MLWPGMTGREQTIPKWFRKQERVFLKDGTFPSEVPGSLPFMILFNPFWDGFSPSQVQGGKDIPC